MSGKIISDAVLIKWKDKHRFEYDDEDVTISFEEDGHCILLNIDNKTSLKLDPELIKRVLKFFYEEDN